MNRKRIDGYCLVSTKQGSTFHLRHDQYANVRKAWLDGARVVDTIGHHGDHCTIKLEDVDGVFDMTAACVMNAVEESRADAADDSLASGVV